MFLVKSLIDFEIDADRIDFVRRDGLLAGGEYGNYDIRRLCDSVFIEQYDKSWIMAFSEKAITSMEALLLDRYRTHVWIHFHPRVIVMKMLVRFLIVKAIEKGVIAKNDFNPKNIHDFVFRDDVWLWSTLRNLDSEDDAVIKMAKRAVFIREKKNILNLWKNRPAYHRFQEQVKKKGRLTEINIRSSELYEKEIGKHIGFETLYFPIDFKPIGKKMIFLYSESEKKLTGKHLFEVSKLLTYLPDIWKDEPQYFILFIGENIEKERKRSEKEWIDFTAEWLQK